MKTYNVPLLSGAEEAVRIYSDYRSVLVLAATQVDRPRGCFTVTHEATGFVIWRTNSLPLARKVGRELAKSPEFSAVEPSDLIIDTAKAKVKWRSPKLGRELKRIRDAILQEVVR